MVPVFGAVVLIEVNAPVEGFIQRAVEVPPITVMSIVMVPEWPGGTYATASDPLGVAAAAT